MNYWQKSLLAGALVCALSACGGSDDAESELDAQFRTNFVETCSKGAIANGAPTDAAQEMCDCSADIVIDEYTMVERAQLRGDKVDAILNRCSEQTGAAPTASE